MIIPLNRELTLEEMGVLCTMINLPEADYRTADYLASLSTDTIKEIQGILNSLTLKEYIFDFHGKYAVNKAKIPLMSVV